MRRRTGQSQRGQQPPTSEGPLRDAYADILHGAPRRVLTDSLGLFAASLPSGGRVLEVGAGHYDHGRFFRDHDLLRFDADPDVAPDVVGDAHAMPLESATFDAVLAISVLEHVDNPFRVTEEIARVLKPGGRVFAWVPFFFAVHGFPGDVTRFTTEGLTGCFEQAGLVVEHADSEPYSGLFFTITDLIHFTLPRKHSRRWVRGLNRSLLPVARVGFPLDKRLKLRTMYAGTELVARKPEVDAAPGSSDAPEPPSGVE